MNPIKLKISGVKATSVYISDVRNNDSRNQN